MAPVGMRSFLSDAAARSLALLVAAAIASLPPATSAAAGVWPPGGKALAEHGATGVPSCASCHGARFEGNRKLGAPALAGKDAADMMDSLYTMATNPNDHSEMANIARKLDMAERAAVTAWLSRLPAKP